MSRQELEEYRNRWTTDTPEMMTLRFQTDNQRTPNIRKLPGKPLPLENLRKKAIEKYGIMGFCALRAALGRNNLSTSNFITSLKEIGLEISKYDASAVSFINMIIKIL